MARSTLKSLAVLLALLPAPAFAQDCFQEGMMYEGHQVIAPGYVRTAQSCQFQCAITLYCAYFTWKAAPNRSLGLIGPEGCLKFNDQAVLVPADGPASETISGPNACPTVAPSTPNGTIPAVPTVPPAPQVPTDTPTVAPGTQTAPPMPSVPPVLPPVLPTGMPTVGPTVAPAGNQLTTITGQLFLAVADAAGFASNTGVIDAIKEGLASALAGVEKTMVKILSITPSRRLQEGQAGQAGSVSANYEINVPGPAPAGLTADSIQSAGSFIQSGINAALTTSGLSQFNVTGITVPTPTLTTKVVDGTGETTDGKSGGGGFPWWAMLLVAILVIGVGAAVLFGMCGGSEKKKKKAKSSKTSKKSMREERQDSSEAQALMRTEAPPPMAEPTSSSQMAAPAAPLPQFQGIQVPGQSQAGFQQPQQQPAFGSQGQGSFQPSFQPPQQPQMAYNSQGQMVMMQPQQPPFGQTVQMQQMPMMQQQFR